MAYTSKLTEKNQATIPAAVRKALRLKKGDTIAFDIAKEGVRLRRATPVDLAYALALNGTLSEWDTKTDGRAFRNI